MIYLKIFWIFFKISLISFGGVFGVLPELQRIIVDQHHWMSTDRFAQSFVVGQFAPGPNMAMCALLGYQIAGLMGAIVAALGIYSGPILVMGGGCALYFRHREKDWVQRMERALRPLVLGLLFSSATILLQTQMANHWILGTLLATPFIALNWKNKIGPLSCIFATGIAWLALIRILEISP